MDWFPFSSLRKEFSETLAYELIHKWIATNRSIVSLKEGVTVVDWCLFYLAPLDVENDYLVVKQYNNHTFILWTLQVKQKTRIVIRTFGDIGNCVKGIFRILHWSNINSTLQVHRSHHGIGRPNVCTHNFLVMIVDCYRIIFVALLL